MTVTKTQDSRSDRRARPPPPPRGAAELERRRARRERERDPSTVPTASREGAPADTAPAPRPAPGGVVCRAGCVCPMCSAWFYVDCGGRPSPSAHRGYGRALKFNFVCDRFFDAFLFTALLLRSKRDAQLYTRAPTQSQTNLALHQALSPSWGEGSTGA